MKQRITNWLLKNVVKVILPSDVIQESQGRIYLGGVAITDEERRSLQAEAKALESMRLWSILNETIKQVCYERGWKNSKSIEELNIAKSMYSILDTQKSIVAKIRDVV